PSANCARAKESPGREGAPTDYGMAGISTVFSVNHPKYAPFPATAVRVPAPAGMISVLAGAPRGCRLTSLGSRTRTDVTVEVTQPMWRERAKTGESCRMRAVVDASSVPSLAARNFQPHIEAVGCRV